MKLLARIADLLWPFTCIGCQKAGMRLCDACSQTLRGNAHRTIVGNLQVVSAESIRNPVIHRAVWELKYRNARHLAAPLGTLLAASFVQTEGMYEQPIIVPVPLHPRRHRVRGYNQSELLAHCLADTVVRPLYSDVLVRVRATKSQVETASREDRLKNMHDAFSVSRPASIAGHQIVLVDDVCTTGATLRACAAALHAAGATDVIALVIARG